MAYTITAVIVQVYGIRPVICLRVAKVYRLKTAITPSKVHPKNTAHRWRLGGHAIMESHHGGLLMFSITLNQCLINWDIAFARKLLEVTIGLKLLSLFIVIAF